MHEISMNEPFGKSIARVIKERWYSHNLEIGSDDGTGSTQCFIEGMKELHHKGLICLENASDDVTLLRNSVKQYEWVTPILTQSIGLGYLIPKTFEDVWNSPHNMHTRTDSPYSHDVVQKWWNDDLATLKKNPIGFLDDDTQHYDAVLIDGSEFTGYSEFCLLRNRSRCFFLDDVHKAYKCCQVYHELKKDAAWLLVEENPEVRNGYAIFCNV